MRSFFIAKNKYGRLSQIQTHIAHHYRAKPIDALSEIHELFRNVNLLEIRHGSHPRLSSRINADNHFGSGSLCG